MKRILTHIWNFGLKCMVYCIYFQIIPFFLLALIWVKIKSKTPNKNQKPRLFWGPYPLINNKYYSLAMKRDGYLSKTVMNTFYDSINSKSDFDIYLRLPQEKLRMKYFGVFLQYVNKLILPLFNFVKHLNQFDIFHFSFNGGILTDTIFRKKEARFIKYANKKIVILGYGSDFYQYSKVINKSWLHTLQIHYPKYALNEDKIRWQVNYWSKNADAVINGMQIDGLGRWDALPFRAEGIDVNDWKPKSNYSVSDGENGVVKIVHAPNHRFIKGTEYLINCIENLKQKGLKVELILLEKLQNSEVKKILHQEADIFFDQLILGYAMSTIEALSTGLPVITNLGNKEYTEVFRRYSYLNECPAVSSNHEELQSVLETLIKNPELRKELGKAGRNYAIKYHSLETIQVLFNKLYDKIWYDKEVDLMNHYHPLLKDSYNSQSKIVEHPLIENKIPSSYFNQKI